MASTIISNNAAYTFGAMTMRLMTGLINANTALERLKTAVATASSGTTDDGTQFEIPTTVVGMPTAVSNLFGVVADPTNPGQRGKDYQYAVNQLDALWTTFWAEAKPYVEQLDQGTTTP